MIYPEHKWSPWKFRHTPRRAWNKEENVRSFLETLSKDFEIEKPDNWYRISKRSIIAKRGGQLLSQHGGLLPLLAKYFPEHDWPSIYNIIVMLYYLGQETRRIAGLSKVQFHLYAFIKKLFPDVESHMDFRHFDLLYAKSRAIMQLDIFVPSLSLAFEYQGRQHFAYVIN